MYKLTCEVCGKVFQADRRDTRFCNTNSTCRVRASRQRKHARIESEKMMIDIDTYALYETIVRALPFAREPFDNLLRETDKASFCRFVARFHDAMSEMGR